MSRKQELYREIRSWAMPYVRNGLSIYHKSRARPLRLLWPRQQRQLRHLCELAEFSHNIYFLILEEEFTLHDIHFLNFQARSFFERSDESGDHRSLFALYIQELFAEVPAEMRSELNWLGPQGDYSRARPRRGDDPSW